MIRSKIAIFITLIIFQACKENNPYKEVSNESALNWSRDIKAKILSDINVPPDSITIDTSKENLRRIIYYSNGIRTKEYGVRTTTGDTVVSYFFSKDQNFELVRELCPGISRSFEGIRYRGRHLGLAEFRFCNGKLKEQGYRFNGDVGIWREWDEDGNLVKETDFKNKEKLDSLSFIKY